MDLIKLEVPLFLRLLELAREEVKHDEDLHDLAEICTLLSKQQVSLSMADYDEIVEYMKNLGNDDSEDQQDSADQELSDIRRLIGKV